jgi:hypothetical protein
MLFNVNSLLNSTFVGLDEMYTSRSAADPLPAAPTCDRRVSPHADFLALLQHEYLYCFCMKRTGCLKKRLYKFESLYEFTQRTCAMF